MFHVINRITGEVLIAKGFWALGEDGRIYDVQDGWGCEGGGGSDMAPSDAVIVFGLAPVEIPAPTPKPIQKDYSYRCSCGQRFVEYHSAANHAAQTKQPGPHIIEDY